MLPITAPTLVHNGLTLNTGRNRDQWHTMTRTGKSPKLGAHLAEPYLEIHPDDAADVGTYHGDLVAVETAQGSAILRSLVTNRVARGQLFAPMHWTRQTARGAVVNALMTSVTDPFSGQPALKRGRGLNVSPFVAKWYGFMACAQKPRATSPYAAIARTATGWQVEMGALESPPDWTEAARSIAQLPEAEAAVYEDSSDGTLRVALSTHGMIQALFFVANSPVALSRSAAIAHIGTDTPPLEALAGRMGNNQPDPGAIVCACLNVGQNTLVKAIGAGAFSVAALGEVTCAGTNCGSCKPELARLVAQHSLPVAAE